MPAAARATIHWAPCRQASRRTQAPSWTISPHSSASSMNSPGARRPRSGCCQRTRASVPDQPQVVDVDEGLVVEDELDLEDGPVEFVGRAQVAAGVALVVVLVDHEPPGTEVLGLVHGDVGAPQEDGRRHRPGGRQGHADAQRDELLEVGLDDRGGHGLAQPVHHLDDLVLVGHLAQHGELVAAEPGQHVARTAAPPGGAARPASAAGRRRRGRSRR